MSNKINVCCDGGPQTPEQVVVSQPSVAGTCAQPLGLTQPYYKQTPICPEDNSKTVIYREISQVFRSLQSFCIPACGASVQVMFEQVTDVAIGAWMWASGLGYLKIKGYNTKTGVIDLQNVCPTGVADQAPVGTPVPSGTVFVLTPPLSGQSSSSGAVNTQPYLASGFVAPADEHCIDISVTNVNGLVVNKVIAVQTGEYRLSAIKSPTLITICNDGGGLTPGTVVDYKDGGGNFIVPIVTIDSNPCLNDAVLHGKLLVCSNNIIRPAEGDSSGQVPVYDQSTGEINFRTIGIPTLDCTVLTACLTLDPALPEGTHYLLQLDSTADFIEGETIIIAGTDFVIDSVDSAHNLHATPVETPSAVQTYPIGTSVCSADCCTVLDNRLNVVEARVLNNIPSDCGDTARWQWCDQAAETGDLGAPATIDNGANTLAGPAVVVTFENKSCKYAMKLLIHYEWHLVFNLAGADGNVRDIGLFCNQSGAVGASPVPVGILYDMPETYVYETTAGGINRHSRHISHVEMVIVAPGDKFTVQAQASVAWNAGTATSASVTSLATVVSGHGVAIGA